MERVRKTFFDPLATSKARIWEILQGLPAGSAHPFSPERILLCRTENGIEEIDISSYPEDYFFNAVDLGEMGETLLRRMAGFPSHLKMFDDFQIMQAPASTFKIPIVSGQITILAVSERTPTYYDFCLADASRNTCCWCKRHTFSGIDHSGDVYHKNDLLDYVRLNTDTMTPKEICVFISGYTNTQITRFLGTNPALLVADHVDKVLYIIPVPLDAATIGDATICCPLVVKRDGNSLICSILSKATTDRNMYCNSDTLNSASFPEAIKRADFTISAPQSNTAQAASESLPKEEAKMDTGTLQRVLAKEKAIITSNTVTLPSFLDLNESQVINFGTGLNFELSQERSHGNSQLSSVVLPCVFGSQLQGPVLLATGTVPTGIPFLDESALRAYYENLKSIVVCVDERMNDNARNLAPSYRLNALFIVQLSTQNKPKNSDEVLSLLNSANINAVTALAGPQSLVLVQILDKYYFYRGLANRDHLNTSKLAFGTDVTTTIESVDIHSIIDTRCKKIIDLNDSNKIILPVSGQFVKPEDLQKLFEELSVDKIHDLEEDINAAVPQLQMLLNQKDLGELSKNLVSTLSAKIANAMAPLRKAYIKFVGEELDMGNSESVKLKNNMLGKLRKSTKDMQKALEPAISSLANMMSAQTTSKRTHDLKRLVRQAQIQSNVDAVKSMTFETLAGYLEEHAEDMGVMLLNIETTPYRELLGNLKNAAIDASQCCDLDSRILYLEGLDAGLIMEQSQSSHNGPLQSRAGPSHPTLAIPYLNQGRGTGSMLAWVCWDEFVNLESPYSVRWMEKCNEPHIAALRIIMRDTLSQAVASREHNLESGDKETGHLMSALLMAAMSKLAAMRTSAPVVSRKVDDTVTKLMRGLFGNLLTIAGSGVRPLSMVWQLFGLSPQYDVPTTEVDWIWYETVVALYPYTGWTQKEFYRNLEQLLDKVIVRVVTKNENVAEIKLNRTLDLIRYCELRNIQLEHSRTIVTILRRMLTTENVDIPAVAGRLLGELPHALEKQSESYTKLIDYLEHLAKGGLRRPTDDLVVASVYTKRSAAFRELKTEILEACESKDWVKVKELCAELQYKHAGIAAIWNVNPDSLVLQNMAPYKELLDTDFEEGTGQHMEPSVKKLIRRVRGDAERKRPAWKVGKKVKHTDNIEPLDEAFIHKIMTGEDPDRKGVVATPGLMLATESTTTVAHEDPFLDPFSEFESSVQPSFIATMQKTLSAEDVCGILKVPVSAMRVFIKALNPEFVEFVWEDLGENFKMVILGLLKDRSNRAESHPTKTLLELGSDKKSLQIEG